MVISTVIVIFLLYLKVSHYYSTVCPQLLDVNPTIKRRDVALRTRLVARDEADPESPSLKAGRDKVIF